MLFQFLTSGTYKKIIYLFFFIFFLIKLYQMSKLLFYSQYYTTFGFAKQNKTLSISIQNNNDYTYIYILGKKPDSFFIVTVEEIVFFKQYITLN